MDLFHFIVSALAVWRLTHLLAKEDGPFDVVFLLRKNIRQPFFAKLFDCFYCLSIWIALPFGIWLAPDWVTKIVTWFALSGAACLLEQVTTKNDDPNQATYHED